MEQIVGRYELRGTLGQGGMADVYRAYDAALDREVALKLLAGHLVYDTAFYRRFEREARIAAPLEHPNIVPVYDTGVHGNRPFLVMRLLRGGTLRDRLVAGAMSRSQLWSAMRQVADALDTAHAAHVVHRDIKPANILFDDKGNAFVSDFGIAKMREVSGVTGNLTGQTLLGTPAYMSPEQFTGGELDGRSDQYSLAVVLFEVLAGRLPFEGVTPQVLMFKHVSERPPDIHSLEPSLSPAASDILQRALAKLPADRYPSVTEFMRALESASYQAGGARTPEATRNQQLQAYYDAGFQAYQHGDWRTAADFLGRVLALDTAFRDTQALYDTSLQRLRERRDSDPAIQVTRGAGGEVTARPARRGNRTALLVGGLALLALLALAAFLWLRPNGSAPMVAGGATVAPTAPAPTLPPPIAGVVQVVAAEQATAENNLGHRQDLAAGARLSLEVGQSVEIVTEEGITQLVLPDGNQLFLGPGTTLALTGAEDNTVVKLTFGRVLAQSARGIDIYNGLGSRTALRGKGLLGARSDASLLFEAACLRGACELAGDEETETTPLAEGEARLVGSNGRAGTAEPADYAAYVSLAPDLVPIPATTTATARATITVAVTETSTPTPTETPTPTVTRATATRPLATAILSPSPPPPPTNTPEPPPPPPPPPSDRDGDGVPDDRDGCPDEHGGGSPDGCPVPPPDRDGDGVPDDRDGCPDEHGGGSPDGCPVASPDRDGDGFPDDVDNCPDYPYPTNGGCPP